MVYLKSDFESKLKTLCPPAFEKEKDASIFTTVEGDAVKRIHISYNSYFPHSALIRGVSVDITIKSIEDILNPILKKYNTKNSNYTIGKSFQDLEDVNYKTLDTDIHDNTTFELVATEVKKIIDKGALPFLERCNSLLNVADLLGDKKAEEIVPYIQGPILLPKTILILREAHHSAYKNKLADFYTLLKQYAERKENYRVFLNIFTDLFFDDLKAF